MRSVEKYVTDLADVHCLVHVDGQTIHVLDVNDENTTSVTNAIEQIQPQILAKYQLSDEVSNYIWVLYGTDGIITVYDGSFRAAPSELILPIFKETMKRLTS